MCKLYGIGLARRRSPLLTQVGEQPVELVAEDGAVLVLVVQLQDLDKVVDAASVLGVLALLEEGVKVVDLHHLLALLLLAAQLLDGGQGGVQVARPQQVPDVETVHLAVALEVVHVEGELDLCKGTVVRTKNRQQVALLLLLKLN